MSGVNSVVSVDVDESIVGVDVDPAILSSTENPPNYEDAAPRRRRRWMFRLRRRTRGGGSDEQSTFGRISVKGLTISCRCRSAMKGSCLILAAAFLELIGCLAALAYGICYIKWAYNFYDLDSDPEKREVEYNTKLERVLFLEENRVGFVGLMATCIIGLLISILMPIGTVYKSWKSLRASKTLLLSVSVVHFLIVFIYLPTHELVASVAVIPWRVFECVLISRYIGHYKRKKLEEIREKVKRATIHTASGPSSQHVLDNSSICSFVTADLMDMAGQTDNNNATSDPNNPTDDQDIGNNCQLGGLVGNLAPDLLKRGPQRGTQRRKLDDYKREERAHQKTPKYDSFIQYDMFK